MIFEEESGLLVDSLHENCVLTPHEGEFERLFGPLLAEKGCKLSGIGGIAGETGFVVLHKDKDTAISFPEGVVIMRDPFSCR